MEFNAWLYQGYDDARTALLQVVADKLNDEVKKRSSLKDTVVEKTKNFAKRINWLQLTKLLVPLTVGFIPGAAPAGAIASLIGSVTNSLKNRDNAEENSNSINSAIETILPEFEGIIKEESSKSMP